MTPYETYVKFFALKTHFSLDNYDYFKYSGKVKLTVENYNNRHNNDRHIFEELSKLPNAQEVLLAHVSENPSIWIGDVSTKSDIFKQWTKRRSSIQYTFLETIKKFEFPQDVQVSDGTHPVLLKSYLRKEVTKETMVILNSIIRYAPYWNKNIQENLVWPKINFNLKKFSPFLKFNSTKYTILMDEYIQEKYDYTHNKEI